jgi:hypothetical protein
VADGAGAALLPQVESSRVKCNTILKEKFVVLLKV